MISEATFYDRRTGSFFEPADGCPLEQWQTGSNVRFAVHARGFPVFDPAAASLADEYRDGDPYQAENSSAFQAQRQELTLELLAELARDGGVERIVDVGCGVGQITALIAQSYPKAIVYGVDRSISAVAHASERPNAVRYCVADAYELPFAPGSMDAVICNNLWEHVPDPLRLLSELSRVLRPRGGLVLSTPSRFRVENLVRVVQGKPVEHMSSHHVTEYTIGQVDELLRFGGFEVTERRSRYVRPPLLTIKDHLLYRVITPLLRTAVRALGSHHELASTVFFLARKAA